MTVGRRTRLALVATFCGLAASALYWPTLGARFVWDDHALIEANPALERWSDLFRGFTTVVEVLREAAYYRPILMASYLVDRKIWGLDPAGFHLTNVLLHGVVSGLVCVLGFAYFENLAAAAIAGLLFALHPIQAQSVSLILGRNDLLLALSVIGILLIGHHRRLVGPILLLYAVALWTKETAIVAPLLLFLADAMLVGKNPEADRRWNVLAPSFAAVAVLYLVTRFMVFGSVATASHDMSLPWSERLPQAMAFAGYYVGHVLFPWSFSPAPYSPRLAHGSALLESVSLFLLFAGAVIWSLWKRAAEAFGLVFFAIGVLPVLGFVPMQVPVLEHRLYLPMIGVALAAAAVFARCDGRWALIVTLPVLGVLVFATSSRLAIFHDDLLLWSTAAERVPDSAYAQLGYGLALARGGRDAAAIEPLSEALRLDPGFNRARYELALALGRTGEREQAIATIQEVLRRDPKDVDAWNALAFFWKKSGDLAKCTDALERGLLVDPKNPVLLGNLGEVLVKAGKTEQAEIVFETLMQLHPEDPSYRKKLDRLRQRTPSAD